MTPCPQTEPTSAERSDQLVQPIIETLARFKPELLGRYGFHDVDEEITTLSPEGFSEQTAAYAGLLRQLERHRGEETDPEVDLDLEIAHDALADELHRCDADGFLPYHDPLAVIFQGLQALLIDPVEPRRRRAAITRLRRYAGLETGYTPLTRQAETLLRAHLGEPGRHAPHGERITADIARGPRLLTAIDRLFHLHDLGGHETALETLRRQLADHHAFLRAELLPKTRPDFRLPAEHLELELRRHGVDLAPEELARRARVAFRETQSELRSLLRLLARERHRPLADYRDLMAELYRERVEPSRLASCYQRRLAELAPTGVEAGIPPLPARGLQVRFASEAEMLFLAAPFLRLPRLLTAIVEPLEIVVPLPSAGAELGDHGFEAASWWLAAHEGWPGHGLQFSHLIDQNLSIARRFLGYNTALVEGWALYAEAEIRPQLPLVAQIAILRQQLLRCVRAWLGLALQQGAIDRADASWWLREKVGVSAATARLELERALFLLPVADIAYFAGYLRLSELRVEAERALGAAFEPRRYHDALLSRGLAPLSRLCPPLWHTPSPCTVANARSS